jgi:hypothetical protein
MKKALLTILAVVVVFGVLAGAGFAGYRYGYVQGASGNAGPFLRGDGFGWNRMPMHNFERGIGPGFQRNFGMMDRGFGFGFFSPLRFLLTLAFWGVVIWLAYKLLTGWRLTLVQPNMPPAKIEPAQTDEKKQE